MFRLRKWYLDCVSARGEAFIGYSARLRWGGLRLGYASALLTPAAGDALESHTFFPGAAPAGGVRGVAWRCRRLGVRGAWRSRSEPVRRLLLGDAAAGIAWECVAPSAATRIRAPAGTLAGLGYAEELTLTLEPWRLPFHTLHWGRFLAPSATWVWIVWEGDAGERLLLRDARIGAPAEFAPCRIVGEDGDSLELTRERVLRSGAIVSPALRSVGRLMKRLPTRFLSAREEKGLSRGRLRVPGSPPITGWAIHEIVRLR